MKGADKMPKMFTKGFKPKSTTTKAKKIIRAEIKDHYADNGKQWLNAVKRDAEAAYDPHTPNTAYHKGANLVQGGSFACYYSDQKQMLGKIYGKENVAKWNGEKTHSTYKHLIGREYAAMVREQSTKRGV
jgi:hypothetical protein